MTQDTASIKALAYTDALNSARNAQNSLFQQYGWTMPNSSGGYDTESTGTAFDPNRLYDKSTGVYNQTSANELSGQMRIGGKGILSDIIRGGGDTEAAAMAQNMATGTGTGGLGAQRRLLAEAQAAGQLSAAKGDYLSQFANANQPIGGAYQDLKTAITSDDTANAITQAGTDSAPVTPSVEAPAASLITSPATRPSIKDSEIRGTYYRGTRQERVKSLRGLIASHTLTPKQQKEVKGLLAQSGFNWNIPK